MLSLLKCESPLMFPIADVWISYWIGNSWLNHVTPISLFNFHWYSYKTFLAASATPIKTHPGVNTKRRPIQYGHKHQSHDSKPGWLLALEIVTGFMVGLLFVVALVTAVKKWKTRPSIIIPWKKSGSAKDYMPIYIGQSLSIIIPFTSHTTVTSKISFGKIMFIEYKFL